MSFANKFYFVIHKCTFALELICLSFFFFVYVPIIYFLISKAVLKVPKDHKYSVPHCLALQVGLSHSEALKVPPQRLHNTLGLTSHLLLLSFFQTRLICRLCGIA